MKPSYVLCTAVPKCWRIRQWIRHPWCTKRIGNWKATRIHSDRIRKREVWRCYLCRDHTFAVQLPDRICTRTVHANSYSRFSGRGPLWDVGSGGGGIEGVVYRYSVFVGRSTSRVTFLSTFSSLNCCTLSILAGGIYDIPSSKLINKSCLFFQTPDLLENIKLVIFPNSIWFGFFKVQKFVSWNKLAWTILVSGLAGPKGLILKWWNSRSYGQSWVFQFAI